MRFQIAQCLCGPNRHAILALAMLPDVTDDPLVLVKTAIEASLAGHGDEVGLPSKLNPWCSLCGSRAWVYEVGWSVEVADWEDAQRRLKESEAAQRGSAALLHLLDLSYDAKRHQNN